MKPDHESASLLAEVLADAAADFATEHCDFTVGDLDRGGPEGIPEPESPKGYGGADIRRSRRAHPPKTQVVMALTPPAATPSPPTEPVAVPPLDPLATPLSPPLAEVVPTPPLDPLTEPIPDPLAEPDFALEHRHLTVGGSDHYRNRRH